jgi:hypothetical protein
LGVFEPSETGGAKLRGSMPSWCKLLAISCKLAEVTGTYSRIGLFRSHGTYSRIGLFRSHGTYGRIGLFRSHKP